MQSGTLFADFESLQRWSVTNPNAFWQATWDFEEIESPIRHELVLSSAAMPVAQWFPGTNAS